MTTTRVIEISSSDDTIDVRDIIARVEELEDCAGPNGDKDGLEELKLLQELLSDLAGNGGDEDWRGDWYPITLVRDSYFEDFAQEEAESCGLIDGNARWPNNCIDWERAARDLQSDYSQVEYEGVTYWYR